MNKQYGHVGVVTGVKRVNSPCCNFIGIDEELPADKEGFIPVITKCSSCGKEFNPLQITIQQ